MRLTLLTLAALLSGCSTTHSVAPRALVALDGWDAKVNSTPRTIETISSGRKARHTWALFDGKNLSLEFNGGRAVSGQFVTLKVDEQRLLGTLSDGRTLDFALASLRRGQLTEFSRGKTLALTLGIVGAVVIPALIGLVVYGLSSLPPVGFCFVICSGA